MSNKAHICEMVHTLLSSIVPLFPPEGLAMDKLAKHSWPSIDTLVIIVSLTVIGVGISIMY